MVEITRKTKETDTSVILDIRGKRRTNVETGIGFFDHMLTSLAFWAGWDLTLSCKGDLHVDTHHTVEDAAIILGQAFLKARLNYTEIERIADALVPMDEVLSRVVVDICNRSYCLFEATLNVEKVGDYETYMTRHFFQSFAEEARITLHIYSITGENVHHVIESFFKGLGLALRKAMVLREGAVASTKGVL